MRAKVNRSEDITYADTDRTRRWIIPEEFYDAELYDDADSVRMMHEVKPGSAFTMAQLSAGAAKQDEIIWSSILGTAYEGKDGATAIAWGAGVTNHTVALAHTDTGAGSPNGLSVSKLRRAHRLLKENMKRPQLTPGEIVCIVSPAGIGQLLGSTRATSGDYVTYEALMNGQVPGLLGIRFVEVVTSTIYSGTEEYAILAHREGLVSGIKNVKTLVERVPSKDSEQALYKFMFAAARVQETMFVRIAFDGASTVAIDTN
jgi:hypothetical protein